MNPLGRLRRAPWLSGALVLVLAVGMLGPVIYAFGPRRWPLYVGMLAVLLLTFGAVERLWRRRAVRRPPKSRKNLRIVPGGKGNGHTYDLEGDDTTDKQRWLM
jgi:hypothetical protein